MLGQKFQIIVSMVNLKVIHAVRARSSTVPVYYNVMSGYGQKPQLIILTAFTSLYSPRANKTVS